MKSTNEAIRNNRNSIRKNIKKQLKLPQVKHRLSLCWTKQPQQPNPQLILDKRDFSNVFVLGPKIGQGGNAIVRQCRQIKTQKIYAVKISKGDDQIIRITKRTYQNLKLCDHPCIIKAKYLFIDQRKDDIMLVMEYCSYPSLQKLIRQRKFSLNNTKMIVKRLLQTLSYIHTKGVCHRDIKPENILYDINTNQLKIIDFGVSKLNYNRKTNFKEKMWTVTGTLHYKAPQMFQGGEYDELVDVWAVGIITYQLFYGYLPFDSEYTGQIIEKICESEPSYDLIDEESTSLTIDFIKALLKKNKSQRINTFQALRHPWIEHKQEQIKKFKRSDDCFLSQLHLNRQKKNTYCEPKYLPLSISSIQEVSVSETPKNHNWKKFQQQKDILQIPKNQMTWLGLVRSSSHEEFTESFSALKDIKEEEDFSNQ